MAQTGTIKKLVKDKGFGFIKDDASGTEYFFHRTGVVKNATPFDNLREGQAVVFETEESPKGPRATRVR